MEHLDGDAPRRGKKRKTGNGSKYKSYAHKATKRRERGVSD
jgi:hypothetical protein